MLRRTFLTVLLCVLFAPAFASAQADNNGGNGGGGNGGGNTNNNGGNGGGGGGGGGGRGNFDPAQWRQRRLDDIKDSLAAKDDEWKVIQPKLEKVMDAQRTTMGGMFGRRGFGGGGRGGPGRDRGGNGGNNGGGQGANNPFGDNPVAQAMQDLNNTLDKKDASAEEINQKLTAFRDARDKAKKELADAQKDLKDVLEPRQEAVLVANGYLD